eukprot:10879823-Alexandrium_andersonii.AAC.1
MRRADPSVLRRRFAPLSAAVVARIRADATNAGGDTHFHPRRVSLGPPEEEDEPEPEAGDGVEMAEEPEALPAEEPLEAL